MLRLRRADRSGTRCSLDIFWLRDESLEDSDEPARRRTCIAAEIVEDLQAALEQFAEIAADLTPAAPMTSSRRQPRHESTATVC